MNLREKIINEFGGLSPELQRAAEFSLQNASQLVVLSMRAFAAEAGVKPATLLRLAQRLGYRGWSELKSDFIDDLGLRNDTYVSKAEKMMARGTQTQLYKEVFQAHQANLTFTQNENAQEMEQAVTLLDSAENVYICGFRASFPIAWSLFYVYRSFHPRTDQPGLRLTHQLCALFTRITGCFTGSPAGRGEDPRHHRLAGFPFSAGGRLHAAVFHRQSVIFPFRGLRHGAGGVFTGDAGGAPRPGGGE